MDLISSLFVFFIGAVAGAVAMHFRSRYGAGQSDLQQQLKLSQQELSQVRQSWQDHVATVDDALKQVKSQLAIIDEQNKDITPILEGEQQTPQFPFFSSEATEILRNKSSQPRVKSNVDEQPLDYSGKPSGLFADKEADTANS